MIIKEVLQAVPGERYRLFESLLFGYILALGYIAIPDNSSYSFNARKFLLCWLFVHGLKMCILSGFWFLSIFAVLGESLTCVCLCVRNLVNKIQSILLNLQSSNLPKMLAMERGWTLLIFKVKSQGHKGNIWKNLVNKIESVLFNLESSKPSTNVCHGKRMNPIDFWD